MRSALGCAALGILLLIVAGTFDAEPLYVTGSALTLLGLGAAGWIAAGAWGSEIERELGASPRAGLMLLRAAKARALLQGRDHALPDDVQALAQPVLSHRLLLSPETVGAPADDVRRRVIADAVEATPAL